MCHFMGFMDLKYKISDHSIIGNGKIQKLLNIWKAQVLFIILRTVLEITAGPQATVVYLSPKCEMVR